VVYFWQGSELGAGMLSFEHADQPIDLRPAQLRVQIGLHRLRQPQLIERNSIDVAAFTGERQNRSSKDARAQVAIARLGRQHFLATRKDLHSSAIGMRLRSSLFRGATSRIRQKIMFKSMRALARSMMVPTLGPPE
jgi:hypothetical protein